MRSYNRLSQLYLHFWTQNLMLLISVYGIDIFWLKCGLWGIVFFKFPKKRGNCELQGIATIFLWLTSQYYPSLVEPSSVFRLQDFGFFIKLGGIYDYRVSACRPIVGCRTSTATRINENAIFVQGVSYEVCEYSSRFATINKKIPKRLKFDFFFQLVEIEVKKQSSQY